MNIMDATNVTLTDSVFSVFEEVAGWFTGSISDFVALFYSSENGLSFLGIMALVGIGIAVARMFFAIITSFVQLRGGR